MSMKLSAQELNWLNNSAVLLTPNLRLSRALIASYGQHQYSQQKTVWEPPAIFAIEMWLQQQWQSIQSTHTILSSAQSALLWERVIGELSPELNANSVVTAAEQAYEFCYLWKLDKQDTAFLQNENSREWLKWVAEFEKRSSLKGFISRQQAVDQLIEAAQKEQFKKQPHVVLMGFDGLAPLYRELLNLLFERVEFHESKERTTDVVRCIATNADDEITQAAHYAKVILTQRPEAAIGIIIHDLTARRERIEKILSDVFEPQAALPNMERYALPFNFSAGEPLKRIPLVRAALQLLAINGSAISTDVILSLLKSPFIKGCKEEMVQRAMLATKLLEEKRSRISLDKLITFATEFSLDRTDKQYQCPLLVVSLKNLKTLVAQQSKRLPSQWSTYFLSVFEAVGYTSDAINSIEFQQRTQFLEQIEQLATFDDLLGLVDHKQVNLLINRLVQQGVFQPKTKRSPIQVLGALEGAGMSFTHVWIAGMHDKAWPPAPKPNPFIPYHLQREKNLPHATAERELLFVKTLFEQYLANTQQLVVSYPAQDDGQDLRASSLIKDYQQPITTQQAPLTYIQQIYQTRSIDTFDDIDSYAIDSNEATRGGTSILKDQSACAFRAFANHRLKAKHIEPIDEGLSKAERGTLLHGCMENSWNELKSHTRLVSLTSEELEGIVLTAIKKETSQLIKELGAQFIEIENQRLLQLIMLWLEIEKLRPPFTLVGTEVNGKILIGRLLLNTYVDRIDEVNGVQVMIDYKTSGTPPSLLAWKNERPDDPQLPLYAIGSEGAVRGIYFAHITRKNQAFIGASEGNEFIPIKPTTFNKWEKDMGSWNDAISTWKLNLEKLANDFIEGKASINPKPTACDYCHLKGLCRINLGALS
jgi:probable DNA repair protein